MPPEILGLTRRIQEALAHVAQSGDLDHLIQRHHFFGTDGERAVGASWLSHRLGFDPGIDRLFITGGTQNCLEILMPRLVGTGGCVATEMLSYAGNTQVCKLFGIRVVGVEIDEYGILPDAFAQVCERHHPKVLYCNPTIHNPTTSNLPEDRRRAIAEIARRHGVIIIEDDVHAKLAPGAFPTIMSIAPDITWYLMSVSKCIGMGLRTAFLVAPDARALIDLREPIQSISSWFVPGISSVVVTHLIKTGAADEIAASIREEVAARQAIATEALDGFDFQTKINALHLWLSLPDRWSVRELVAAVRPHNVVVRPSDLCNAGGIMMPNKVRLSLVAPRSKRDLAYAVKIIADNLRREPKQ
nr:PLP-dependent aminotransferase family protein [Bradyrhizobium oropedii]